MAMKNLCRLCANEDVISKDLILESNQSVRKMVQEFIQIAVSIIQLVLKQATQYN